MATRKIKEGDTVYLVRGRTKLESEDWARFVGLRKGDKAIVGSVLFRDYGIVGGGGNSTVNIDIVYIDGIGIPASRFALTKPRKTKKNGTTKRKNSARTNSK